MLSPFVAVILRELRKERTVDAKLSDGRYATERLGVSPTNISLVMSGQRPPGAKLMVGAFRAYPHNHATNEPPPTPDPLPEDWLADGLEAGCGCVACDLADAAALGFGPPRLAVPTSRFGSILRPAGFPSQSRLLRLANTKAGISEEEPEAAAAH